MINIKKILLIVGVTLSMATTTVQASTMEMDLVDYESEFVDESESTVEIYSRTRGIYLSRGNATITNPGIGYVGAGASTYATMIVPSISVSACLQVYTNSKWTTVATFSASSTNSAYAGVDKLYSVSRGYYYRVYSVHTAYGETNFGATSGIYIS